MVCKEIAPFIFPIIIYRKAGGYCFTGNTVNTFSRAPGYTLLFCQILDDLLLIIINFFHKVFFYTSGILIQLHLTKKTYILHCSTPFSKIRHTPTL